MLPNNTSSIQYKGHRVTLVCYAHNAYYLNVYIRFYSLVLILFYDALLQCLAIESSKALREDDLFNSKEMWTDAAATYAVNGAGAVASSTDRMVPDPSSSISSGCTAVAITTAATTAPTGIVESMNHSLSPSRADLQDLYDGGNGGGGGDDDDDTCSDSADGEGDVTLNLSPNFDRSLIRSATIAAASPMDVSPATMPAFAIAGAHVAMGEGDASPIPLEPDDGSRIEAGSGSVRFESRHIHKLGHRGNLKSTARPFTHTSSKDSPKPLKSALKASSTSFATSWGSSVAKASLSKGSKGSGFSLSAMLKSGKLDSGLLRRSTVSEMKKHKKSGSQRVSSKHGAPRNTGDSRLDRLAVDIAADYEKPAGASNSSGGGFDGTSGADSGDECSDMAGGDQSYLDGESDSDEDADME